MPLQAENLFLLCYKAHACLPQEAGCKRPALQESGEKNQDRKSVV